MATKSVLGGDYSLDERTDDELVDLARTGGSRTGAWDELYRRHATGARSVARHILRSRNDADDVVNEAFAGVISAIGHGAGPRSNFKHYLMACVRNGCRKRASRNNDSVATDPRVLEQSHGAAFEDPERFAEAGLVSDAFSSLSVDWQRALWMTAVENRPTEEVARELGRRPAAVAALAHRAREAFAEAYLSQHQHRVSSPACERITPKLPHYVRGRSGDIDRARVEHHLTRCASCSQAVTDLRDVNRALRTITVPTTVFSGGAVLTLVGAGAASGVGTASGIGVAGWAGSFVSGATLAKVAAIVALVVPATVLATESQRPTHSIQDSGASVDTSDDIEDSDATAAVSESAAPSLVDLGTSVTEVVAIPSTDVVNSADLASDVTSGAERNVAGSELPSSPETAAGTTVVAPVGTTPGSTTSPTVAPGASTPVIVVVPPTTPDVPAVTTPPLDTPIVTVPAITTPPVTAPPATLPPIVEAPSGVTPLTVADAPLPTLPPLPLPKLPDLIGNRAPGVDDPDAPVVPDAPAADVSTDVAAEGTLSEDI